LPFAAMNAAQPTCGTKAHITKLSALLEKRASLPQAERTKLVNKVKALLKVVRAVKAEKQLSKAKLDPQGATKIGAALETAFDCGNGKNWVSHIHKQSPTLLPLLGDVEEAHVTLSELADIVDMLDEYAIDSHKHKDL
jgi:hypothetical protein